MNQEIALERASHPETSHPETSHTERKRIVPIAVEISNRLTRIAKKRIQSSQYSEIRRIQCEVREGILFLKGQVSSYYIKQLAQEIVRTVEGIGGLANHVEVTYPDTPRKVRSDHS